MAGTRSSARLAGQSSSPPKNEAGTKRKAATDASPSKGKKGKKEQKTLEQTGIDTDETKQEDNKEESKEESKEENKEESKEEIKSDNKEENQDTEMKDEKPANLQEGGDGKAREAFSGQNKEGESMEDPEKALKDSRGGAGLNALDGGKPSATADGLNKADVKQSEAEVPHDDVHDDLHQTTKAQNGQAEADGNGAADKTEGAVEESKERADAQPRNVLEKGIIYFFTRGRVGVEDLNSVQDLQRSYFVLRPLSDGAKIGDGKLEDTDNNRLLALPKKVWPKSGKDRFMAFVEKGKTTIKDLKEEFFQGSEYSTKTTGVRQTPPVTTVGEGIYAITSINGRESHLAYMLTIPKEVGELQEDIGIRPQGSFVISLKNPESKGPANAALPTKPDWPSEFQDEFRGRSWMPVEPKHINYNSAQILLIGEDIENSHALEATKEDQDSSQKETPQEEMEKLEHEDEIRVEHLKGDDTVFTDLGLSKKEYPDVPTTW
ncbi:hypothetical protein MBLNU457_2253t2 [Dothideomycetes sp. NU457]